MYELINMQKLEINAPKFKNDFLNKATERIAAIYTNAANYADTKNREIAKILGEVADKKAYEKDGFKSVADYANTVFGINRQNAYALATAGKVYNDEKANDELKKFSPSKIAEIAKVDEKALNAALESGEISAETTQKELREFANKANAKDDSAAKVVDTFTVKLLSSFQIPDDIRARWEEENHTIEEWQDGISTYLSLRNAKPDNDATEIVETVKLPKALAKPEAKKATVNRDLFLSPSASIVVEYHVYIKPPKTPKPAPKFTEAELLEMLEALRAEKSGSAEK